MRDTISAHFVRTQLPVLKVCFCPVLLSAACNCAHQFRRLTVFEFGRAGKIALTFGLFDFNFDVVICFMSAVLEDAAFRLSDFVQIGVSFFADRRFLRLSTQTFFAGLVAFFGSDAFFHF